jgi:hypothetical protein
MEGNAVKLSKAQRRDLERLFVKRCDGQSSLSPHVTTISTVTSLRRLAVLEQLGLLRYAEIPDFYARFGVLGWHCRLTTAARGVLERELAKEAS